MNSSSSGSRKSPIEAVDGAGNTGGSVGGVAQPDSGAPSRSINNNVLSTTITSSNKNTVHDAFLSSMTFASFSDMACECDECDLPDTVPPTIRNAVNEHIRKRRQQEQPILFNQQAAYNIQQKRELIKRECGFSVWKFELPCGGGNSDPLVEYRNQHRILFVKQLHKV